LQKSGETRFLIATLAPLGGAALALGEHPDVCGYLEERIRSRGEVDSWRMNYELTVGSTILAYAARRSGRPDQARRCLSQALQPAIKTHNRVSLIQALAAVSLVLADGDEDDRTRAMELYALLCRYPHVANSRWYEDTVGKHINAIALTLAPDAVAPAQERGRARDLWETAEALLEDLGG
jgi:hypothetical protein